MDGRLLAQEALDHPGLVSFREFCLYTEDFEEFFDEFKDNGVAPNGETVSPTACTVRWHAVARRNAPL